MHHFIHTFTQDLMILLQGGVALLLGGIIGWERESVGKWAGLRTHMLVCFASMLFVKIGLLLTEIVLERNQEILSIDPVRIVEAIVSGIAFLGAGTIFRDPDHGRMQGLTTAATLLTVAPIGIAIAIGHYTLAVGVTILTLVVLRVMARLEIAANLRSPDQDEL